MATDDSRPHRLLLAWEATEPRIQVAILLPVLVVALFLVHLGPLNQPLGRAITYGVFWGVLATGAIVAATRNEARKRRAGDVTEEPSDRDG